MTAPPVLVEVERSGLVESVHRGHAVVVDASGEVVRAWGEPDTVIYPRSAVKPLQAVGMVEAGLALISRVRMLNSVDWQLNQVGADWEDRAAERRSRRAISSAMVFPGPKRATHRVARVKLGDPPARRELAPPPPPPAPASSPH